MSRKPDLKLDWCSYEAAKYAVEHWHYSRCVPNQKMVKVGVWEDGQFIGCILFGTGANNNMGKPYGVKDIEVCELVRIALRRHSAPVSRIVRIALDFLRQRCPTVRIIVSYADPEHGHHGGIYQAGGWVYAGLTTVADEYVVNGIRMHGRALRSTRSTHRFGSLPAANVMAWAKQVLDPNIRQVLGSSKHRYLYPLDRDIRKRLIPLAKPYPKRAASIVPDAPSHQGGEDGRQPIAALQ